MTDDVAYPSLTPLRLAAIGGILWSAFGVFEFTTSATSDAAALMARGLTQAQAEMYATMPLWMQAAFGIATIGGVLGSLLLLLRRKLAVPVLGLSLIACVVLFIGDWALGVFALFGMVQVVTLCLVLLIAVLLLYGARRWAAKGLLN